MEEISRLRAIFDADPSGFNSALNSVKGGISETKGLVQSLGSAIATLGAMGFLTNSIADAREAAAGLRQLDAVLESTADVSVKVWQATGGMHEETYKTTEKIKDATGAHEKKVEVMKKALVANGHYVEMEKATRASILETSDALMKLTGIDDDVITSAQALLLTFTKIGKDIMPDATAATLDMAAALGISNKEAAIQLGKALQSAQGVTALTRSGVTFTKAEMQKIEALFASGRAMEAQRMILNELNNEFGGSAAAQADNVTKMQTAWGNFTENIGGVFLPVVEFAAGVLTNIIYQAEPLIPVIAALTATFAGFGVAMSPIGAILGTILLPIGAVTAAVAGLYAIWQTNFLGIQTAITSAWNAISPALKEISKGITNFFDTLAGGGGENQSSDKFKDILIESLPKGDQNILKALKFQLDLTDEQRAGLTKEGKKLYDDVLSLITPQEIKPTLSLGEKLGNAISASLPEFQKGLSDLMTGAKTWLETEGQKFLEDGMKAALSLGQDVVAWVQTNGPNIVEGMISLWEGVKTWLETTGSGLFQEALKGALKLGQDIASFVINNGPDIVFGIETWVGDAWTWIKNNVGTKLTESLQNGLKLVGDLTATIAGAAPDIGMAIGSWIRGGLTWLTNEAPKLIQNAIAGLFSQPMDTSGMQGGDIAADMMQPTVFEQLGQQAMDALYNVFQAGVGLISGLFEGIFGLKEGSIKKVFDDFFGTKGKKGMVGEAIDNAKTFVDGFITKIKDIGSAISAVFANVLEVIIKPFKDALVWIGKQLLALADKMPVLQNELRAVGGGLVEFGGGSAFASPGGGGPGFHALGGRMFAGQAGIVGENGPEIFKPDRSGTVISGPQTAGILNSRGGGSTLNISGLVINGVQNAEQFFDELQMEARKRGLQLAY